MTTIISATVAGLRGPGLTGEDQELLVDAKEVAAEAVARSAELGIAANQNPYGQTMVEMEGFNSVRFDPITNATLIARGYLNSMRDISGAKQSYAIGYFDQPTVEGASAALRFGLIAASAGNFGSPRVLPRRADGSFGAPVAAVLDEAVSSTVHFYSCVLPNLGAEFTSYLVGSQEWSGGSGSEVRVFGVQHHRSTAAVYSMRAEDYPDPVGDTLNLSRANLPPRIFMTAGYPPLPIFVQNAFPDRTLGYRATLVTAQAGVPVVQESGGILQLDPAQTTNGTTVQLWLSRPTASSKRWIAGNESGDPGIVIQKAAFASTASPKILTIGTSLTNRYLGSTLNGLLIARGMTPTFMGTILQAGGAYGEGREGKTWAQTAGLAGGLMTVPLGGEAAYLALSENDKMGYNPFINPTTGLYDFSLYVSRFLGGVSPTHIVIEEGPNDVIQAVNAGTWRTGAYLDTVKASLATMVASIKAYSGGINVALFQQVTARVDGDLQWKLQSTIVNECIRFVNNPFDPKVALVAAYLSQTPEAGYPVPATTVTGDTHMTVGTIAGAPTLGAVHFDDPNRTLGARCLSDWIGCTA